MVQFTTTVNASLELTWKNLLDKIYNPQNFVPGVSDVIISEKNTDFVLRQMTVTNDMGSTILKEKITFEPYKVRFLLLDHPKLEGYVDNDIKAISDNETEMTFTIHWIDKTTKMEINDFELVKNAVLKTKNYIENNQL
jgi:multisubunit Na+/H+ antiporter MnhE subunit